MKRGQTKIIVFLIFIIILFIVTILIFFAKPSLSGGSVKEITEEKTIKIVCDKGYIKTNNECCLDNNENNLCDSEEPKPEIKEDAINKSLGEALITDPFFISSFTITKQGVELQITNNGEEDFNIREVKIKDCGKINPYRIVYKKGVISFLIPCKILSEDFNKKISVIYSKRKADYESIALGFINGKVNKN